MTPAPVSTPPDAPADQDNDLQLRSMGVADWGMPRTRQVTGAKGTVAIVSPSAALQVVRGPENKTVWFAQHSQDKKRDNMLALAARYEFGEQQLNRLMSEQEIAAFQKTGTVPPSLLSSAPGAKPTQEFSEKFVNDQLGFLKKVGADCGMAKDASASVQAFPNGNAYQVSGAGSELHVYENQKGDRVWFGNKDSNSTPKTGPNADFSYYLGPKNQLNRALNPQEIEAFMASGTVPEQVRVGAASSPGQPGTSPSPSSANEPAAAGSPDKKPTLDQSIDARRLEEIKTKAAKAGMSKNAWAISPQPGVFLVQDAVSEIQVDTNGPKPSWKCSSTNPQTAKNLEGQLNEMFGPQTGALRPSPTNVQVTPAAAVSSQGVLGKTGSLIGKAGKGIWSYVKAHPFETAFTAATVGAAIFTAPVSGTALLGLAGGRALLGVAGRRATVGIIGRMVARRGLTKGLSMAGRFAMRGGARGLAKRGAMATLRAVPGMASDFLSQAAKSLRQVGSSLATFAAGTLGIAKGAGGMSNVMAGAGHQDAAPNDLGSTAPEQPDQTQDAPLPGDQAASNLSRASRASKAAPTTPKTSVTPQSPGVPLER